MNTFEEKLDDLLVEIWNEIGSWDDWGRVTISLPPAGYRVVKNHLTPMFRFQRAEPAEGSFLDFHTTFGVVRFMPVEGEGL